LLEEGADVALDARVLVRVHDRGSGRNARRNELAVEVENALPERRPRRRRPRRQPLYSFGATCSSKSARHFAASEAVSYLVPSVPCQRQSSDGGAMGRNTSSVTTVAPFRLFGTPRRVTIPCQTMTRSSPSAASLLASANQDTLTAA